MLLSAIASIYRYALQPFPPFAFFGTSISILDVIGAVRTCLLLRQLREHNRREHTRRFGKTSVEPERSYARDFCGTLVVVYGGEAVVGTCSERVSLELGLTKAVRLKEVS
jgi:hypothetical protein